MTLGHYTTEFKPEFKHCIKLLMTKDKDLRYCLTYKDWIDHCPSRCGYFEEGEAGMIEDVKKRKLDYECIYFTRTRESQDYFCTLVEQDNPYCDSCHFTAYKD